jgi:Histidine kinase-, DNA gyrase B-, and HSP90-like ATPase
VATIGHFSVRPRLINILGAQYHSTEEALKELVANAWDADATMVGIELPEPLVPGAIVVRDNGYGMTPRQVQADYLSVAYDRRKQGDRTPKDRKVRGFRGIGKFAGLMAAARMTVKTTARGVQTQFTLDRAIVEQDAEELGQAEIALVEIPNSNGSGTEVRLEGLLQNFAAPSPEKLGRVLLREFARQDDFQITIDGVALSHEMLEGERSEVAFTAPDGNVASGIIWLADKARAIADPGIIVRVNGRAIGPPTFFGLDQEPDIPKSLLARLSGEINADYLADDVIASWSGIIDNSQGY